MTSRYVLSIDNLEEVLGSLDKSSKEFPLDLEVSVFVGRDQDGFKETTVAITADAVSETEEEGNRALNHIHRLPVIRKALKSHVFVSCTMKELLKRFDDLLDNRGRRYEANNLWTDEPVTELMPYLRENLGNMPAAPSHLYLLWWVPRKLRADMAFSMEGNLYVALYGIGTDPSNDLKHADYVVESMQTMTRHRKGIQLADENLPAHPGKFMKTRNYQRLEQLRQKYDPHGRFYSYMKVLPEFEKATFRNNI